MKTGEHIVIVDVWKFLFSLILMYFHLRGSLIDRISHFDSAWILVEFFFIVSGCLTARSLLKDGGQNTAAGNAAACSVRYVFHKYSRIFPYVIIVTVIRYVFEAVMHAHTLKEFLFTFGKMPYEALLLTSTGLSRPLNLPVWYLSAMLFTLPFVCMLLLRARNLYTWILCWAIPALYYGFAGIKNTTAVLHQILRAFSGLSLGVMVYMLSRYVGAKRLSREARIALTVAELLCFTGIVALLYMITGNAHKMDVIALITVGCVLMFSGQSYTLRVQGRFLRWLGALSLPIYISHTMVREFVRALLPALPNTAKIAVYYAATIAFSIALYALVQWGTRRFGHKGRRAEAVCPAV